MSEQGSTVQVLNSNIIQIKRGKEPPDRALAPYELGYAINNGTLYIGGALELIKEGKDGEPDEYGYGKTQSIRVGYANTADTADTASKADRLTDQTLGNTSTPIYLYNGMPRTCTEMITTLGGTINGSLTLKNNLILSLYNNYFVERQTHQSVL